MHQFVAAHRLHFADCCRQLDDMERAVLVDVKRKDIIVEQRGAALTLDKFKGLKDPMIWANEKFGGNKEKRAATMTEFQKDRLHSPFTMACAQAMQRGDKAYQKEIKDKAINIFDTVQKFMRQRNSLKIPQRLDELLTDCVQHPFLRLVRVSLLEGSFVLAVITFVCSFAGTRRTSVSSSNAQTIQMISQTSNLRTKSMLALWPWSCWRFA